MPIGIYTANGGASKGRINVFLYNDAGGVPGTSIDGPLHASSQPLSFDNGHGGGLVAYTCFACPPLTAGTQYWVVAYVKAAETGVGIFEMEPASSSAERQDFMPIVEWVAGEQRPRTDKIRVIELGRARWAG